MCLKRREEKRERERCEERESVHSILARKSREMGDFIRCCRACRFVFFFFSLLFFTGFGSDKNKMEDCEFVITLLSIYSARPKSISH